MAQGLGGPGGKERGRRPAGLARACGSLAVYTGTKARGGGLRRSGLGKPLVLGPSGTISLSPQKDSEERAELGVRPWARMENTHPSQDTARRARFGGVATSVLQITAQWPAASPLPSSGGWRGWQSDGAEQEGVV